MHHLFVQEFRLRRLSYLSTSDVIRLLQAYTLSDSIQGVSKRSEKFIEACDRHLGKNSDRLTAVEMEWLFDLYQMLKKQGSANCLTHKLLMKLQR